MKTLRAKLSQLNMPHTYVILAGLLVLVTALTYIIPGGEYTRVVDPESGVMVVEADSFQFTQGERPGFFALFLALQRGYVSAASILFLIVFAYSYVYMLIDNGTLMGAINALVRMVGEKTHLFIPVCMTIFGLLGSTMGIYEEVYGLIPVFIGISMALGYDGLVGGATVFVGIATGFAAATVNPFSIGIAQSIAEVPMFSGLAYRVVLFVVFMAASIAYVMRYAARVKANPERSVVYGLDMAAPARRDGGDEHLTGRQKLCLGLFAVTIGALLYGTTRLGWYVDELAAMFLMMMVLTGAASGYSPTKICESLIQSTKNIVPSILVVGFTRGILLIMQEAKISDTIVYYLSGMLYGHSRYFSAVGMLALQNVINFFVTGSSSQATITMPIMVSVADIVGLSRQTAVLVYHFGDGFSNMFWPTACALECGLMNIPLNKWYRFIGPLFGIMVGLQVVFTMLSVVVYV